MAQNSAPRRFYIDHAENHALVRAVQVQRSAVTPPVTPESAATHQMTTPEPDQTALVSKKITERARIAPRAVTDLVRSARKHAHRA